MRGYIGDDVLERMVVGWLIGGFRYWWFVGMWFVGLIKIDDLIQWC